MAMNEKMMILKMLDEGKITTAESIKLIKACDETKAVDEIIEKVKKFYEVAKEKAEPICGEVFENAKEAYKKAEPKIKEAYKKAEPKIKEAAKKVKEAYKETEPKVKEAYKKAEPKVKDAIKKVNDKVKTECKKRKTK